MAHNRRLVLVLSALSLPFVAGCGLKEKARDFLQGEEHQAAAMTIGGQTYSRIDLERFFDSRLSEFRDPANGDKIKSNLLEEFIEEKLLLRQAERKNVQPDLRTVKAMMERVDPAGTERQGEQSAARKELESRVTESLKMQQYLNEYLLKDLSVSDDECESYYKAHLGDYVKNDVVRVREILIDDPALAEKILVLLKAKKNRNFGDLARVYSKAPSAADGGDLGLFERGDLPEEFEKAVFKLSPGSVSKVVRTQYGYHIFLVEEKIMAHQQKLIEVKDQIKEKLRLEREREIISAEIESLKKEMPVVIHRDLLGFRYIGNRY